MVLENKALKEIFDIVDENGVPTGETIERSIAHEKGIRHATSHVWIMRYHQGKLQILLQKRSMIKDSYPGQYDTSSAGHITAGDDPAHSALRELSEELGIDIRPEELKPIGHFEMYYRKMFHGNWFFDNEYCHVFLVDKEIDVSDLTLQEEEVERVDYFDMDELYKGLHEDDERFCVPIDGVNVLRRYLGLPIW